MAKGGRRNHAGKPPKPTDMKVLQGTFRDDRHGAEVHVPAKWPPPPAHLSERERALWNSLEGSCQTWVAESDWPALNGAVALMDRILRIQDAQRDAETPTAGNPLAFKYSTDGDGNVTAEPKENPLFTMELKFWTGLRGYIAILGLSPADRARMKPTEAEKPAANPLDRFVKRG
jgi:hypothetical protein